MAAGALMGFCAMSIGKDLITGGANGQPVSVDLSTWAAILVAGLLLMCLAIVAIGFVFPRAGIPMKMVEDREQWEDERSMMVLSCVGGGAYAAALLLIALAKPLVWLGSV